ncbi:MAG: serine/threonine protein kinase [Gemmataceae bacterium]|nr:serine/threonine protein kinase [Gemmataceae bacterium]
MLLSTIGRYADEAEREADPYAGWLEAIRRLREEWGAGERPGVPQLRDYLKDILPGHRAGALQDLVAEHLQLTWRAGRGVTLEAYFAEFGGEFPELASPRAVPAELVEDEFLARYLLPHGDTPSPEDYQSRFAARADVFDLLWGRCLAEGRYVKLRLRGRGAMGEVWEAYDRYLGRAVAVKEPNAGPGSSADLLHRFAEEARLSAGLEHPGIVGVHEYHEGSDRTPFYVMKLVDGRSLGEWIREYHQPALERSTGEQRLLWDRLLHAFLAVCDAITYAHTRGVLHRDLKPGNIIVGGGGETVILDWGVGMRLRAARPSTPATAPGGVPPGCAVVGTPQYMPPEQADGNADERSDVFGLGAVLYEILTGQAPHPWAAGALPRNWQHQVREAQLLPPQRLNGQAPRALEAVCLKALARQPADRYQGAAALARDLRCYLAGLPVEGWAEPLTSRAWRWLCGGCR